jgi:adenylate cyclase
VNLASRLEGLCPQYGAGVVVSGETRAGCAGAFGFQYLDTLRVKGKVQPVRVYAPMPLEEEAARGAELLSWQEACALYQAGNFAPAVEALEALRADFPGRKLYAVYAERAQRLAAAPPESWDGVWTMTSK